jgi:hypothetical protein
MLAKLGNVPFVARRQAVLGLTALEPAYQWGNRASMSSW